MTQEEKLNIVEDYTKNGLTLVKIQNKYSHSYKTVKKILDEYNVPHTKQNNIHKLRGKGSNIKNQRILTSEEEKIVCDTYKKYGTVKACEEAISSGQDVVRRCLQKYNLYRPQKEIYQYLPQNQRKYWVNDNFFSSENSEMAYIMGFIAADGSIRKNLNELKIGLSAVDKPFLEMIASKIGGRPIKEYTTNTGYDCVNWVATSKKIKDDLAKYNIVPNKTFTFTFPKNLNKKYWLDFIRGYFDGDGSVSTAGPHAIRWQLCAANKDVLETVINFFYEEYDIPKVSILEAMRKHALYYIQYSSTSTRKIYDIFYPEGSLYLPRKKEKFEQLYELNLKK